MRERILGKDRDRLIRELKNDRTLIRIVSADKNYEQLSTIIDLQDNRGPFFLVDPPDGFRRVIKELDGGALDFLFTARDGFQYHFKASDVHIYGEKIRVSFPEVIERADRRAHLRIKIPSGIEFRFREDGHEYKLKVRNISSGGIFVEWPGPDKNGTGSPTLNFGKTINDSALVFPSERRNWKVRIKKAFIIRSSENSGPENHGIAIQFTEIQDDEKKALKEMISDIQRNIFNR